MYPHRIFAAVASSAPVLAFPHPDHVANNQKGLFYGDMGASYWRVVTRGHAAPCAHRIYKTLTSRDLTAVLDELGVCRDSRAASLRAVDLASWIAFAFENLAMGDFPFVTDYIAPGLPAFPAHAACVEFKTATDPWEGLRAAIGVWYNATKKVRCHHVPKRWDPDFYDGLWDRMWCLNLMPQETFFATKGWPHDMFPAIPVTFDGIDTHCLAHYGTRPDRFAVHRMFGATTEKEWVEKASRIVFSNGMLDPWSAGGLAVGSKELPVVTIPNGAHHVDLFFSTVQDPFDVVSARVRTMKHVRRWLEAERTVGAALVS
jgi:lysosomal Pro-X carboxypeptidase